MTTAEDVFQEKRQEIEVKISFEKHFRFDQKFSGDFKKILREREAETIAKSIVASILDNIRTPERARSPVGLYMTDQELFQENNPDVKANFFLFN